MLRRLVVAALLTTVAAAPVAGLPAVSAQAPNLGGSDAGISRTLDASALAAAQPNVGGGVQSLPSSTSPTLTAAPTTDVPTPRSDVPATQNPTLTSLPTPAAPAPQPTFSIAPAAPSGAATAFDRTVANATPVMSSPPAAAAQTDDSDTVPSERQVARDLGAWAPGVTEPLNEPVADRSMAVPAPVSPVRAAAVPQPAMAAAVAPPAAAAESAPAAAVEEAPTEESVPAELAAAAPAPREAVTVPIFTNPRAVAFVPPGTATPVLATSSAASPASGESETANAEIADAATASVTDAAPAAPGLPRASSPAQAPAFSIPALASLDMPGGLNLSLFVVLFGALGSAALGLHLLLRRIEATL